MHKRVEIKNALSYDEKLFSLSKYENRSKCEKLLKNSSNFNNNSIKNVEIKKETQELRPNEAQQIKEPEPSYYAVIPANVRYDTRLSPLAKLLYGEITCLCQKEGFCWATNAYFERLYGKTKRQIINLINQLEQYGYISKEIEYDEKTKQVKKRFLRLSGTKKEDSCEKNFTTPGEKNFTTPGEKNFTYNNTSINNINIKKVSKKESQLETDKNLIGGVKNNSVSISEKKETKNNKKINSSSISQKQTKVKKAKPKPISFDSIIDAYTENEDLRAELKEHLKTRKQKKAALNNRAIELSLKKLDRLADSDEEKLLIVQNSIMNGWVGFFPLNQDEKRQLRDKPSYNLNEYEKTMDTFESEPRSPLPFQLGNWL